MVPDSVIQQVAANHDRAMYGAFRRATLIGGIAAGLVTVTGIVVTAATNNSEASLMIGGSGIGLVSFAMGARQLFALAATQTKDAEYKPTKTGIYFATKSLENIGIAHG